MLLSTLLNFPLLSSPVSPYLSLPPWFLPLPLSLPFNPPPSFPPLPFIPSLPPSLPSLPPSCPFPPFSLPHPSGCRQEEGGGHVWSSIHPCGIATVNCSEFDRAFDQYGIIKRQCTKEGGHARVKLYSSGTFQIPIKDTSLYNEDTVYSPKYIELCTNLHLNSDTSQYTTASWVPMVSTIERFQTVSFNNVVLPCYAYVQGTG